MIQGLEQSVSIVIKACPETMINGKWLAENLSNCIAILSNADFKFVVLFATTMQQMFRL